MIFEKKTAVAEFIHRPNRFIAQVKLNDEILTVHVPNTGRLKEILLPGVKCLVRCEDNPARKTSHSLIGAWKNDMLINFDSQIPNQVVAEALLMGRVESLRQYDVIEREKTFESSRFDFRLKGDGLPDYYLEVKGVTLESGGIVSFPDAVTVRGARHLKELAAAKAMGFGAGLLFLVQLETAEYFTPNTPMDPLFTESLKQAAAKGVDIMAYLSHVTMKSLTLNRQIPVVIKT